MVGVMLGRGVLLFCYYFCLMRLLLPVLGGYGSVSWEDIYSNTVSMVMDVQT